MKFVFIGDVHGDLDFCRSVCRANSVAQIIQIGDLGVGFVRMTELFGLPNNFHFFPGNHDCRHLCEKVPSFMGHFGEWKGKFFFVSGADSIDKHLRTEGVNWWPTEELSYQQATECLEQWENSKTEILVSHDLPQSFAEGYKLIYDKTLTRNLLQKMIEARKPKMLIYGHHHKSTRLNFEGIEVVGLDINEIYPLDI